MWSVNSSSLPPCRELSGDCTAGCHCVSGKHGFEDALRTAVSLGGDSDTLAAITGSIAEAFYGVPENLKQECRQRLTPELAEMLEKWENVL